MVGLKETESVDFIADSGAVKKVKKVNFHFSFPDNIFDHDPKNFDQFSLFHFFHFFHFFQQPQDGHLLNRSIFDQRKRVKKVKKSEKWKMFT